MPFASLKWSMVWWISVLIFIIVLDHPQILGVRFGSGLSQEFADRTDDQAERRFELVGDILEEGFLLMCCSTSSSRRNALHQVSAHGNKPDESVDECADQEEIDYHHGQGKVQGRRIRESDELCFSEE